MHTPSTGSFAPLADYLSGLRATDPEALNRALFAAHQVLPYLTPPHSQTLSAAILELIPPSEATAQWLESLFFVGGPEAEQALSRFLLSATEPSEAALAQTWLRLLETEKTFVTTPPLPKAPATHARSCSGLATSWGAFQSQVPPAPLSRATAHPPPAPPKK